VQPHELPQTTFGFDTPKHCAVHCSAPHAINEFEQLFFAFAQFIAQIPSEHCIDTPKQEPCALQFKVHSYLPGH
jgi:hypothetical protein